MKVIHGLQVESARLDRSVLTVGNFDGVHRGHRKIIAVARSLAQRADAPVVALTFEPHPLSVIRPNAAPERLNSPRRKLAYLEEAGADVVVVAKSDPALFSLDPDTFVRDLIVARFHPTDVVEGRNFGYGRGRAGNVETLQREGAEYGFHVHIVEPVQAANPDGTTQRVSSSFVRSLLKEGQVEQAADALDKPYALDGTVVQGEGRGRSLGFPTANVAGGEQLIPADGVYAGRAEVVGQSHLAAISIGTTPTFEGAKRQIEAHVLDLSQDLYGKPITLHFERRIRDQRRFESREALIAQIELDITQIRKGLP